MVVLGGGAVSYERVTFAGAARDPSPETHMAATLATYGDLWVVWQVEHVVAGAVDLCSRVLEGGIFL